MNKILFLMLAMLLVLTFAACGDNRTTGGGDNAVTTTPPPTPPDDYESIIEAAEYALFTVIHAGITLNITRPHEAILESFAYIHEVDYTTVRTARDGSAEPSGDLIAIWASHPLYQLELVLIGNDMIHEDGTVFFIPISTHEKIDVLRPEQLYVIKHYIGLGTMPWSGITFLDEHGERHYFWMQQDMSGYYSFLMGSFENRTDELPDDWEPWW